jgi:hypothetical protein
MNEFNALANEICDLTLTWEPKLLALPQQVISERQNSQHRTIKQILGHLVDSASNNTHRIVHLHYQESPLNFPDYAHFGNNDKWIAIQNYQEEDWQNLVRLWKYINLHIAHLIRNVDSSKLDNIWIAATREKISLKTMVTDFPRHLKLHLNEINELLSD